jgi:hypothetical protein
MNPRRDITEAVEQYLGSLRDRTAKVLRDLAQAKRSASARCEADGDHSAAYEFEIVAITLDSAAELVRRVPLFPPNDRPPNADH